MRKTDTSSLLSGPNDHLESFFDVMLHFQSHGFFSDPGECHIQQNCKVLQPPVLLSQDHSQGTTDQLTRMGKMVLY